MGPNNNVTSSTPLSPALLDINGKNIPAAIDRADKGTNQILRWVKKVIHKIRHKLMVLENLAIYQKEIRSWGKKLPKFTPTMNTKNEQKASIGHLDYSMQERYLWLYLTKYGECVNWTLNCKYLLWRTFYLIMPIEVYKPNKVYFDRR